MLPICILPPAPAADAAGQDADVEQAQDEAPAPASAATAPLLAAGGDDTQESSNDQDAPPTAGSVAGAGNTSASDDSQPAAPSVMEGDNQTGGGSPTFSFSLAGTGSVAINRGHNDVSAVVESETDDNSTLSLSDFTVETEDKTNLTAAAGGLNVAFGKEAKAAIGGSVALNALGTGKKVDASGKLVSDNKTQLNQAEVIGYDIIKLTGAMNVQAIDTATITTVGAGLGLAGKDSYVAFQGTDATTLLDKDTKAKVLNTNINKDISNQGTLNVKASTKNTIKAYSLVFEGNLGKAAIGIALAQNLMNADTGVTIAGGTYKLADVLATANSDQTLDNYTVGMAAGLAKATIGGSVVVNTMDNDTTATLGYADGNKVTNVDTTGSTGVVSSSREIYENYSGQINIGLSNNALGGGAAVAVNKFEGDTIAKTRNAVINTGVSGDGVKVHDSINNTDTTYNGLVVDADAYHKLYNAPFSGGLTIATGAVALGLDAVVSIDSINGATKALVNSVNLNKDKTGSIDSGNNFTVLATDKMNSEAVVTNAVLTLGKDVSVAVGASVNTEKNSRTVRAAVEGDEKRKTINADKFSVKADSNARLKAINTAVSVSASKTASGALTTGVTYADLNETTEAVVKGITGYNNGLSIVANHIDHITLIGTGVTLALSPSLYSGGGAVGVAVAAENNTSATEARLDSSDIYHYTGGEAEDVIKATGDSTTLTQTANVSAALSTISVAVGVLVADNDLHQTVKATATNVNAGGNIAVQAKETVKTNTTIGGGSLGVVSVQVEANKQKFTGQVGANIVGGDWKAGKNIDVDAILEGELKNHTVQVGVGVAAVGVTISELIKEEDSSTDITLNTAKMKADNI